ncbi:MAG: hypothetical protein MPJ06_03970 [Nitrosopumilus sp.]|nr:hypothetical protein [Nitrosopumilus sp.]
MPVYEFHPQSTIGGVDLVRGEAYREEGGQVQAVKRAGKGDGKCREAFPGLVLDCLEGWADNAREEFIQAGVKRI